MSAGIQRVYSVSMASGATLTTALNMARPYSTVYLEVGSMISNTQIYIQAAASAAGVYRRLIIPVVNTATIGHNTFTISSASTGHLMEIPRGLQFIKIETTATCDSGETFNLVCFDQ